jgi:MoCo/4Fe-4S cofactor protein with predicted Tat translocation signal
MINPAESAPFDIATLRARVHGSGPEYWRSLEELSNSKDFQEWVHREFPDSASVWNNEVSRRSFLTLMAASLALAGLTSCSRQPLAKIVPYAQPPENITPGKLLYFSTAMPLGGIGMGLIVKSHMGRPIKVEGNPNHPASLGATDIFAQASILGLYDPDRSQVVTHAGLESTWEKFSSALISDLDTQAVNQGAGLRVLTEKITSLTLFDQIQALLKKFPLAKWHQYEPAAQDSKCEGDLMVFGEPVNTFYHFEKANVILSLDSDFLCMGPGGVRYARDFASKRKITDSSFEMSRLYVVESTPSNTGAIADYRVPLSSWQIESFARVLCQQLGISEIDSDHSNDKLPGWFPSLIRDLQANRGASIVTAGDTQSGRVHALVHLINRALGNLGNTVIFTDPIEASPVSQVESLRELVRDMNAGKVSSLIMLGGNPVYNAHADLRFRESLSQVNFRVHHSLYQDETSYECHWHIPETHFLESWGDIRAFDGTVSIIQPLIAPLYAGRSAHEFLAVLLGTQQTGYDTIQAYWKSRAVGDFNNFWYAALNDGVISGTAAKVKAVNWNIDTRILNTVPQNLSNDVEVLFRPDPTIWDGRFSNNGWLQELPKPITKLTWDNPALISPALAEKLGLQNEDVIELKNTNSSIKMPVWISPGHAQQSVTVFLGYGRQRAGRVGTRIGWDVNLLRNSNNPWSISGVKITKLNETIPLACTQLHHNIDNRHTVRSANLEHFKNDPDFANRGVEAPSADQTLYPPYRYEGYAWGMAIDLNACVGCSACVLACQSENNIPIVGKTEVIRGREMHWLRIDRYYKGELDNPETLFQPMLCQHCENAPCEVVCPVAATEHSSEGLNEMIYNRCVGTRYCSNNCPYKVRRFNFFEYSDYKTPSTKLMYNPEVTVRSRGVMEKCTYCVQRIQLAKIESEKENRKLRDGEIVTACQAACPTEAIIFGDINDPNSRVMRLKSQTRNYGVLADLNTRPRTTYLALVKNSEARFQ